MMSRIPCVSIHEKSSDLDLHPIYSTHTEWAEILGTREHDATLETIHDLDRSHIMEIV